MFEFLEMLIKGIFTQPTTSVVSILLLVVSGVTWLFVKMLKQNKEIQESLLREISKANSRNIDLLKEITEVKQLSFSNKIRIAESVALTEVINDKISKLLEKSE